MPIEAEQNVPKKDTVNIVDAFPCPRSICPEILSMVNGKLSEIFTQGGVVSCANAEIECTGNKY